jgi:glycosyltransferase involved in cell wall biosynthesis
VTSHDSPFTIARYYKGFTLGGYRWLRAFMAWHVLRQARKVSTVSPYMVQQIQHLCRVPVDVVPNPVGDPVFLLQRTVEPGRQRVLMVCNGWGAHKNPEPALEAFAAVARQVPVAELVVLGHGFGPGGQAEQWWRAHGLTGQVRFIGPVPYAQVLQWMAQSELLLHPSLEESFGAVIAEAMAVGLPVVAGRASGAVPWVVGEHGRLLDVQEPAAMAAAMLELLADAPLRESLGKAARLSVASRFSAKAVVAQYIALYAQVLATPAAVPA